MTITNRRDVLHQAIDNLPESTLSDLARFIEFLQFKAQEFEPDDTLRDISADDDENSIAETKSPPPFNPVYFPESVLPEFDFSPEYIKEARQEFLVGFGEGFE